MSDENKNTTDNNGASPEGENKRSAHPIKTFNGIISFVGNVYKKYGSADILSNEKIADANNLSLNSIKQLLSTCCQYNCFKNIHGKGYRITPEFTKIYHPENDEEKTQAVIDSLLGVPFYSQLFIDYNDKMVPSLEGLVNRFIRNNDMKQHVAQRAAEIFLQNLKDYGLINSRNILIVKVRGNFGTHTFATQSAPIAEVAQEDATFIKAKQKSGGVGGDDSNMIKLPVPMSDDSFAYVIFPKSYTEDDLEMISDIVLAYKKRKKKTNQNRVDELG